jgi:hypothetical protein
MATKEAAKPIQMHKKLAAGIKLSRTTALVMPFKSLKTVL